VLTLLLLVYELLIHHLHLDQFRGLMASTSSLNGEEVLLGVLPLHNQFATLRVAFLPPIQLLQQLVVSTFHYLY